MKVVAKVVDYPDFDNDISATECLIQIKFSILDLQTKAYNISHY